jgi:hypothetical protein
MLFCLQARGDKSIFPIRSSAAHLAADLDSNAEVVGGAAAKSTIGQVTAFSSKWPSHQVSIEHPSPEHQGGEKGAIAHSQLARFLGNRFRFALRNGPTMEGPSGS